MSKTAIAAWVFFICGIGAAQGPEPENWFMQGGFSWPFFGCCLLFVSLILAAIVAVRRLKEINDYVP